MRHPTSYDAPTAKAPTCRTPHTHFLKVAEVAAFDRKGRYRFQWEN